MFASFQVTDQKDIKDASNINISQPFVPKGEYKIWII